MSLKHIKESLDRLGRTRVDDLGEVDRILRGARTEVDAIEKAAHFFNTVDTKDRSAANARRAAEVGALFHAIAKGSSQS
jgi:hypothetical protein